MTTKYNKCPKNLLQVRRSHHGHSEASTEPSGWQDYAKFRNFGDFLTLGNLQDGSVYIVGPVLCKLRCADIGLQEKRQYITEKCK
jgi:hypothetical protein